MKINSKFTRILGVGLSTAMLASTVLTAVPAMALTSATVTTNNTGVSQNGTWDIRFTVNTAVMDGATGGNITLTFPSGFTVNQSAANVTSVTVAAGDGWTSTTVNGPPTMTVTTINSTAATRRIRIAFAAGDVIGADAQVRIILPVGVVTNPSTAGTYNITVATSNETTAVTSANFAITLPNIGPLPGQIEGKNSNGDVLYRNITSNLSAVIATPAVSRIELAAGTYNATNTASIDGQTIVGVGAAGSVILTAGAASVPLTVSAVNVTVQNVVIQGNRDSTANLVNVTGNNSKFDGVTFSGGVNQVSSNLSAAASLITINNCTFTVTGNVSRGFTSGNTSVITNSTFTLDSGATGILGVTSINTTPTVLEITASNFTATGNTFSGPGAGISVSGNGTATISNNTFTGVGQSAIASTGGAGHVGAVSVKNNTISASGSTNASTSTGVVTVSGGNVNLINNTISNSASVNYALWVSGGNLTARFNNITGNTLNVREIGGTANATLNWWGSSTGPASSSLNATTAANLVTTPYLTGAASNGAVGYSTSNLTAKTTAGVDVSSANGTLNYVSAAKYAANPQTVAPAGNPIAYFDVSIGVTTGVEPGSISIRFYGTVTEDTKVYYGGGLTGAWSLASTQGVNMANGYAFVTITSGSSPSYADMGGTPFVITNMVSAPAAPTLVGPTGTNVPLNTGFSWNPVTGATSYNFQVSTSPTFATTISSQTGLTATVYGGVALTSNTTYFWRVQAVNSGGSSSWATGTFTTAAPAAPPASTLPPITNNVTVPAPIVNIAPAQVTVTPPNVTVNPPQVTVQAPPPAQVTVNPPAVTIQAPPPAVVNVAPPVVEQAIPTYILLTIILIGAVLIIALIVLIVRTRRVA